MFLAYNDMNKYLAFVLRALVVFIAFVSIKRIIAEPETDWLSTATGAFIGLIFVGGILYFEKRMSFKTEFHGRKKLSATKKSTYQIIGLAEILIGLFVLIKAGTDLNPFYILLIIGGILNLVFGVIGKEIRRERNFLAITSKEIEFKSSFKKPQKVKTNDLLDLRIENTTAEFVMTDQQVILYDFSVFHRIEQANIVEQLERMRSELVVPDNTCRI